MTFDFIRYVLRRLFYSSSWAYMIYMYIHLGKSRVIEHEEHE